MAEKTTFGGEFKTSEESSRTEIVLGKAEGSAYVAALLYLSKVEASDSGERTLGDYVVAYAVEEAEGLYQMRGGKLEFQEHPEENCHLEISVRSAADGRFLPGLRVRITVAEEGGGEVGTYDLPFLWHPWIYHYGRNLTVPSDGNYRLRVQVDAPDFPRHDRINGKRFEEPIDTEFKIRIKTGRNISRAA